MKLYDSYRAPNPRRVRWFMAEKGIDDIEVVSLNLMKGEHRTPEYLAKAGVANVPALALDDGAMITDYIYAYPPNDFGLYNMAGNVNEWVQDVYRPLSFEDVEDLNPFRRDGFLDPKENYASGTDPKDFHSLVNDEVRVYKGGSWKDVAYWLSPGTRRFMTQDSSTATIGFRCAMINAGSNH